MAYATPAQMLLRYDSRTIGQLVADDDTQVSASGLLTDTVLAAALGDASGRIDSALLQGGRYTTDDLEGLTGNNATYLVRICCDIAMEFLWQRRPYYDIERYKQARELAEDHLKLLQSGKDIFDIASVQNASVPSNYAPTVYQYDNIGMIRDRTRGYFPARRLIPPQ